MNKNYLFVKEEELEVKNSNVSSLFNEAFTLNKTMIIVLSKA